MWPPVSTIHAWVAPRPGGPLEPFEYDASLAPDQIRVEVSHCGVCHSDVHLVDGDWESSTYPLVPGHEIVGRVVEAGSAVGGLTLGDRVGIGWQAGSCHHCRYCTEGWENLCTQHQPTAVGRFGGFADQIVVDHRFAFKIPKALSSAGAAPLLCGGVTVFSPLRRLVKPGDRVGVIGIGGLGHLALRFARAMGCRVTAFTHSPDKADEARQLGAHDVVAGADGQAIRALGPRFDLILNTAFADLDWAAFVDALAPHGTLCFVGNPPSPVAIEAGALFADRRITGSGIGGRAMIRDMLAFAALHGIEAQTESMPMAEADAALAHVRAGKARFRVVLTR